MDLIEDLIKEIAAISSHNLEKPLPLHEPDFKETRADFYLLDCIKSGWVSTAGNWVNKFEKKLCEITRSKYAVAITNGTDALRLALFIVGSLFTNVCYLTSLIVALYISSYDIICISPLLEP